MAMGNVMKKKRPNIFWTSCATHILNLMLQRIGNLPKFKGVTDKDGLWMVVMKNLSLVWEWMERHQSSRNVEVSELHEEDFVSNEDTKEEEKDDEEVEFESNTEIVLEGYGQEDSDA
ncbi:hypothetical protein D8674_025902 [Pyrus ussuriensis x Pyrus communis]|uniref:DUF659 domain-containing protein n=1 Tax=Pyrus ussuriensis x Pyrus communis TaxID=2448454 RepID=A0A5N5I6G3_9ROSA|nr:hypothetical protein D8674_025902 [Pyrus ussuriensis x Pyrus communis]